MTETKLIPLTNGKFAIVDASDYTELSKFRWRARHNRHLVYAERHTHINGKQATISMHAAIANTPKGMDTDHINGNGLDNRRENLRVVTHRQNLQNRHDKKTSKYPGVYWSNNLAKWRAQICIDGKNRHLGCYDNEEEAFAKYLNSCENISDVPPPRVPTGVCLCKSTGRWHAGIYINKRHRYLGSYPSKGDAIARVKIARDWQVAEL